ncbi:MAG: type II secretion system protein [Candidatus Saccharimonadales bacterium]
MIRKPKKGFTIIELMLAMLFLSMLLVTIALLIVQITGIYQKGLSLRAVSSSGKQLIDEFTRVVGGSPLGQSIMPASSSKSDIDKAVQQYYVSNPIGGTLQHSGTFCTGSYSYIWNTWYSMVDGQGQKLSVNGKEYRLARIMDATRDVCAQANGTKSGLNNVRQVNIRVADAEPIELLNSDESDLILYNFTVFPATQQTLTGQSFYSATFILATIRGGVDIQTSGDFCEVDDSETLGLSSDFNYCAVNKFNFAMRATGYAEGEDMYGETGDKL